MSARLYGATSQVIVFGVVTVLTELFKEEQKVVVALGRALQQCCACGETFWDIRQRMVAVKNIDP
jgi:hypothetical protein